MSRLGVISVHLVALPLAVVVSLPIAVAMAAASRQAIDIHLDDTLFVVAHFHVTVIVACAAVAVTLVAGRYGSMNWLVKASWFLLTVHVVSAVLPWAPRAAMLGKADEFVFATPSRPELFVVYVVSALAAASTVLLGLIVSLWRSLRTKDGAGS